MIDIPAGERSDGSRRSVSGALVALAAAAALAWIGGPLGVVGGVGLVAAWALTTSRYAFAVGQVALAANGSALELRHLALVEALLFGVLVVADSDGETDASVAVGTVAAAAAFGGIAWGSQSTWETLWVTALVLLGFGGLVAYALHRYELVAFGSVTHE